MAREYPDWLDPRKAAEGRRCYSGSMLLSRMDRLRELLANPGGEAGFVVGFEFDGEGRVVISVEVEAKVTLLCQSSLEPYQEQIKRRSLLGVIENIADDSLLPDHYEPVLVENHQLTMVDLVEDELLLGIPQIPRNPQIEEVNPPSEAGAASDESEKEPPMRQPFADLAEQLKKHAQDTKN